MIKMVYFSGKLGLSTVKKVSNLFIEYFIYTPN
jgi:hypothetical protein